MYSFECPHCGSRFGATLSLTADVDRCAKCGNSCRIPDACESYSIAPRATNDELPRGVVLSRKGGCGWSVELSTRSDVASALLSYAFFLAVCIVATQRSPSGAFVFWALFTAYTPTQLYLITMGMAGRISIASDGHRVTVFTGIFRLGRYREFMLDDLRAIRVMVKDKRATISRIIMIEADDTVEFGSLLRPDQRGFLIDLLFREYCNAKQEAT